MSFYNRAESPPPRQPSPEPVYSPLPSPHMRARDRLRHRNSSPLVPPGLAPPRTLVQSKSCDHLRADAETSRRASLRVTEPKSLRRRVRSNLEPAKFAPFDSAPTSSQSSYASTPVNSPSRPQRRTISLAVPPSPSASPSIPPVPPLPDSARSSPLFKASAKDSAAHVTPIYLPDLQELSPASQRTAEKKPSKRPSLISLTGLSSSKSSSSPSPTEKSSRNIGMTCLKFFSLHKSSSRSFLRPGATSSQ
ncbi:hypothetical protein CC1G_00407 [Coprinopsis cinerea okayama7|uniref:Uncharacterized protein n=1 Tax=Coprinopsis cinerea (strain Okayama-7 / 130 / ATCC MYA-4618 / FGSC 9003) TaxID=240176 RepID=A8NXU6_COPC7|nr:hypothetical protein CC1G_00407 [Coprinopsis cinerea okayama7\|eukprot:XP_001837271.1 hypothetical protein CC1G_00407 [Coprinopsis cinerea okayama7\